MTDEEPFADLEPMKDTPVSQPVGVAALALGFALKYHDIATVQDGALYQQYKLEGKNMQPLHLDIVFETAMRIEAHLVLGHKRITEMLVPAVAEALLAAAEAEDVADPPTEPGADGG